MLLYLFIYFIYLFIYLFKYIYICCIYAYLATVHLHTLYKCKLSHELVHTDTHTHIYTYIYIDWNPFSHPLSITRPAIHFSVCVLNTWICFLPVCFLGDALGLYPRQYISEERNVIPECPELNLWYFYQSSVGHKKIWNNIQQKDTPNEKKSRQRDGAEHWTE